VKSSHPVSPSQKKGSPLSVTKNLLFSDIRSSGHNPVFVTVLQDKHKNVYVKKKKIVVLIMF
jgi:hypothetical protein